jgi:hypothetical protein
MIMAPPLRKLGLAAPHITLALGWVGALAGYIALSLEVSAAEQPGC